MAGPGIEHEKQEYIEEVVGRLRKLSPLQVDIIESIIKRFSDGVDGELLREDFLKQEAFEFFGVRLSAHHAYSSQKLKKENFEHILEQSFNRTGSKAVPAESMTVRGADLKVDNVTLSLKTESAKSIKAEHITISKLMEAAWIKTVRELGDIPPLIAKMVIPHFENYDRIFILRSYDDGSKAGSVKYDLHEIPKALLAEIGNLQAHDFSPLTKTRTTSAVVSWAGRPAFKFRLDGSDDKLTITNLSVAICPLHAWWRLDAPG
jgi:hypothetical protein